MSWPTAVVLGLAAALIGALVAVVAGPAPPRLDESVTGDPTLAGKAREVLGSEGRRGLAVAVVDGDDVRFAGLGRTSPDDPPVDEQTP